MRHRVAAAVLVLLAGCAHPAQRAPAPPVNTSARHVDPGNIRRVRRDLPPGYEVAPVTGSVAPQTIWGVGDAGVVTPARCAVLADPAGGRGQPAQGISASGAGGTVYAVVVAVPSGPVVLDQSVVTLCRQWGITGRRARARVRVIEPPRLDSADTVGLAADVVTAVEGGNEIASRATTFTAYLGDSYAFTTLINDPGSPAQALTPQFAADLLVKTVSALRA